MMMFVMSNSAITHTKLTRLAPAKAPCGMTRMQASGILDSSPNILRKAIPGSLMCLSRQTARLSGRLPTQLCIISRGWQTAMRPFKMMTFPAAAMAAQVTMATGAHPRSQVKACQLRPRKARAEGVPSAPVAPAAVRGQRCTMALSTDPLVHTTAPPQGTATTQRLFSSRAPQDRFASAMALGHPRHGRPAANSGEPLVVTCGVNTCQTHLCRRSHPPATSCRRLCPHNGGSGIRPEHTQTAARGCR